MKYEGNSVYIIKLVREAGDRDGSGCCPLEEVDVPVPPIVTWHPPSYGAFITSMANTGGRASQLTHTASAPLLGKRGPHCPLVDGRESSAWICLNTHGAVLS